MKEYYYWLWSIHVINKNMKVVNFHLISGEDKKLIVKHKERSHKFNWNKVNGVANTLVWL